MQGLAGLRLSENLLSLVDSGKLCKWFRDHNRTPVKLSVVTIRLIMWRRDSIIFGLGYVAGGLCPPWHARIAVMIRGTGVR